MKEEKSAALLPPDTVTKKETLFVEPETMCCDDITKVVIGGGINIFKVTGSLNKYIRSMINNEVEQDFAKSSNMQGMF